MIDREKVIDALNRCTLQGRHSGKMHQEACAACLYRRVGKCNFTALMKDVLELLKEQEPVPVAERWDTGYYYVCGNCGRKFGILAHDPVYCPDCGRKVKWE